MMASYMPTLGLVSGFFDCSMSKEPNADTHRFHSYDPPDTQNEWFRMLSIKFFHLSN